MNLKPKFATILIALLLASVFGFSSHSNQIEKPANMSVATQIQLAASQSQKNACVAKCQRKVDGCISNGETQDMCRFGIHDSCFEHCENM